MAEEIRIDVSSTQSRRIGGQVELHRHAAYMAKTLRRTINPASAESAMNALLVIVLWAELCDPLCSTHATTLSNG